MKISWNPKDTEVLTAVDDHRIATLRFGLAASALFIIYVDPTEPDRHVPLTYLALLLYCVYSAAIYVITSHKKELSWRVFVAMEAADIAVCTVLISLSSGTNSVFFFLYFFAVIMGAMRGGSVFGIGVTIISAVLFTAFGYLGTGGAIELNRFLLRPLYLVALGYIISVWAGAEIQLKKKLALLRQLSVTASPRFNMDRLIGEFLERLLGFYNADACILVLANPEGEGYRLHRANRQSPTAGSNSVGISTETECPLLPLSHFSAIVYRENTGLKGTVYESCDSKNSRRREHLLGCGSQTAEWLDTQSFIAAPMQARNKTLGSLCLTRGRDAFDLDDAVFLQQIVAQIVPMLENIRLVDRLASEAAQQERRTIARSIHDRVIQPYIGLQMGLDAVRQCLRSELREKKAECSGANGLRSVELLEQLSTMTKDGVEELREYVYGLRRSDGSQTRLVDSIRRFACQFSDVSGIDVRIVNGLSDVILYDRLAAEVFQMVTEALSNVRRHTKASYIVIYLENVKNTFVIRCENDDSDENSHRHFRPVSIADRSEALGGQTLVWSDDGYTKVQVEIPL